jgi:sarcosine oxidase subunit gamma
MEGNVMGEHERSALSRFWGTDDAASIEAPSFTAKEMPNRQKLTLRGDGSEAFQQIVEACTGTPLPLNEMGSTSDDPCCLRIDDDEWLISSSSRPALDRELAGTLQEFHSTVFGAKSAWVILELSGNNVRDLLARGCDLDLHPKQFPPGRFAQTNIVNVPVWLYHQISAEKIDLYVDRSLAMDLWLWLRDTAKQLSI